MACFVEGNHTYPAGSLLFQEDVGVLALGRVRRETDAVAPDRSRQVESRLLLHDLHRPAVPAPDKIRVPRERREDFHPVELEPSLVVPAVVAADLLDRSRRCEILACHPRFLDELPLKTLQCDLPSLAPLSGGLHHLFNGDELRGDDRAILFGIPVHFPENAPLPLFFRSAGSLPERRQRPERHHPLLLAGDEVAQREFPSGDLLLRRKREHLGKFDAIEQERIAGLAQFVEGVQEEGTVLRIDQRFRGRP